MAARLEISRWVPAALIAAICAPLGLLSGAEPSLAITGAFAMAFALVAFSDLTTGLALYTLLIFIEPGLLGKALLAGTLVLALAWAAKVTAISDEGSRTRAFFGEHRVAGLLLLGFLGWAALSTSWARETDEAALEVSRYALNLTLFVIVFTAVQTRKQAALVMSAYVIGAVLVSVVGPYVRPDFLGPSVVYGSPGEFRFTGGLSDPNEFAAVVLPAIALAAGGVVALRRSRGLWILAIIALAAAVVTFLLTASRGGLVGLIVALVAAIVVAGRWRAQATALLALMVASVVAYFALFAPSGIQERFEAPTQGEVNVQQSRLTLWEVGGRMVADQPVAGVGAGNFEERAPEYVLEPGATYRTDTVVDERQPAHNTYLHVLAEMGVVGLFMFLGILGFCLRSTMIAARNFARARDLPMEVMSRSLLVGQAGSVAAVFFFSAQPINKFWLVLALGPALLTISRASPGGRAGSPEH